MLGRLHYNYAKFLLLLHLLLSLMYTRVCLMLRFGCRHEHGIDYMIATDKQLLCIVIPRSSSVRRRTKKKEGERERKRIGAEAH